MGDTMASEEQGDLRTGVVSGEHPGLEAAMGIPSRAASGLILRHGQWTTGT